METTTPPMTTFEADQYLMDALGQIPVTDTFTTADVVDRCQGATGKSRAWFRVRLERLVLEGFLGRDETTGHYRRVQRVVKLGI